MDELMKEILRYALKKMKKDLKYEQSINELFTKQDNLEYRKSFYELNVMFKKNEKIRDVTFKDYCKNFMQISDGNIIKLSAMIRRIIHEIREQKSEGKEK